MIKVGVDNTNPLINYYKLHSGHSQLSGRQKAPLLTLVDSRMFSELQLASSIIYIAS